MTMNPARYRARSDAGTWHLQHGTHTSHKRLFVRVTARAALAPARRQGRSLRADDDVAAVRSSLAAGSCASATASCGPPSGWLR